MVESENLSHRDVSNTVASFCKSWRNVPNNDIFINTLFFKASNSELHDSSQLLFGVFMVCMFPHLD